MEDLKKSRCYGPDVTLIFREGQYFVEKTYRNKALPIRALGRILVQWERFIYSRLAKVQGIPRVYPSGEAFTLITRYMGGENLRETSKTPDRLYFERLNTLIDAMHKAGIIHLDLRNRRNYGIDPQDRPYLIDFASSICLVRPRWLRDVLQKIDTMGFIKVKAKLNPSLLTDQEKRLLERGNSLSSMWLPGITSRVIRLFGQKGKKP